MSLPVEAVPHCQNIRPYKPPSTGVGNCWTTLNRLFCEDFLFSQVASDSKRLSKSVQEIRLNFGRWQKYYRNLCRNPWLCRVRDPDARSDFFFWKPSINMRVKNYSKPAKLSNCETAIWISFCAGRSTLGRGCGALSNLNGSARSRLNMTICGWLWNGA